MKRLTMTAAGLVGFAVAGMSLAVALRRTRRIELRGRVAVVTGGGRGLGLAITRELVARGCCVAICGRDGQIIQRAVNELRKHGADVFGKACDASYPSDVKEFIEEVLAHYGMIDILVNNAGQSFVGPAVELEAEDMARAIRNTFWTHYFPTMEVLPHMRRRGFGRIANVTSMGGKVPMPHQAAYVAGKYAATGWSQTLALELAKENILVSTIAPPPLRDGAPLHVHYNGHAEEEFEWFTRALTSRLGTTSAERTARVVVDAITYGDRERTVSALAWLSSRAHAVAPNLMGRALAWLDGRLPSPAPGGRSRMRLGAEIVRTSADQHVHELAKRASAQEALYMPNGVPKN